MDVRSGGTARILRRQRGAPFRFQVGRREGVLRGLRLSAISARNRAGFGRRQAVLQQVEQIARAGLRALPERDRRLTADLAADEPELARLVDRYLQRFDYEGIHRLLAEVAEP